MGSPSRLCDLFQVKKSWLYDQVQAKKIKSLRLGGRNLRFRRSDIEEYLDSCVQ
jgi:excisionase family DNA binding protein